MAMLATACMCFMNPPMTIPGSLVWVISVPIRTATALQITTSWCPAVTRNNLPYRSDTNACSCSDPSFGNSGTCRFFPFFNVTTEPIPHLQ